MYRWPAVHLAPPHISPLARISLGVMMHSNRETRHPDLPSDLGITTHSPRETLTPNSDVVLLFPSTIWEEWCQTPRWHSDSSTFTHFLPLKLFYHFLKIFTKLFCSWVSCLLTQKSFCNFHRLSYKNKTKPAQTIKRILVFSFILLEQHRYFCGFWEPLSHQGGGRAECPSLLNLRQMSLSDKA